MDYAAIHTALYDRLRTHADGATARALFGVELELQVGARVRRLLPVRMRGGLLERAAERRVLERRQARAAQSSGHRAGGT